jgi:hypothetical protein
LAGTKVPSTKHSLRSSPPASWRCAANASRIFLITPERTQFCNPRCAVWYAPYRSGRPFQGAPVRRIQSTPWRTARRSLQGRPRLSSRIGSWGRMVETTFHWSSDKSIHHYYTVTGPCTSDILAPYLHPEAQFCSENSICSKPFPARIQKSRTTDPFLPKGECVEVSNTLTK